MDESIEQRIRAHMVEMSTVASVIRAKMNNLEADRMEIMSLPFRAQTPVRAREHEAISGQMEALRHHLRQCEASRLLAAETSLELGKLRLKSDVRWSVTLVMIAGLVGLALVAIQHGGL